MHDMRRYTFSLNIDECMSAAHQKVFSVLVSYFSEEEQSCVVKHYLSVTLQTVNAETLHKCLKEALKKDEIPESNMMSILSDSANYMRGKISGLETRMRKDAEHLLDIDGDMCHHVHNIVKTFCRSFNSTVEKLADDLFTDFRWSPDLKGYLDEICTALEIPCQLPRQRIPHRWLSTFDVTIPIYAMFTVFTLFYWAWLPKDDLSVYKDIVTPLTENLSTEAKDSIKQTQKKLREKKLTEDGKNRKQRLVKGFFYHRDSTLLALGLFIDLLPIFKSFVLMFEQAEPMMHSLHDELTDLVKTFLSGFIRPEHLKDKSVKELARLNVSESNMQRDKDLYVGRKAEKLLHALPQHSQARKDFFKSLREAYTKTGEYMLKKFPLENNLLQCLSAIDPKVQGHNATFLKLKQLGKLFPTVLKPDELHDFNEECRAMQIVDTAFLPVVQSPEGEVKRADHWWAEVAQSKKYPKLILVVKACLSIFTGPQIEQAFSQMNQIITPTSNRLDVQTYSAMISIRFHLKAKKMTSLTWFHRNDIHKDPIDKGIAHAMQTAYNTYQKKIRAARQEKVEKHQALKVKAAQTSTKIDIHAMAKRIGKNIQKKRKSEVPPSTLKKTKRQ